MRLGTATPNKELEMLLSLGNMPMPSPIIGALPKGNLPAPAMTGPAEPAIRPSVPKIAELENQLGAIDNPPRKKNQTLFNVLDAFGRGLTYGGADPQWVAEFEAKRLGDEYQRKDHQRQTIKQDIANLKQGDRQEDADAMNRAEFNTQQELAPLRKRTAEAQAGTAELNLEKAKMPVSPELKTRNVERDGKKFIEYFPDGQPDKVVYTAEAGTVTESDGSYQDRRARLVEEAYAEKLKKPVEQLTATERVAAQRWHSSMSPADQTEFDKRLNLYKTDPTTYNALYGRGATGTTPEQLATTRRQILNQAHSSGVASQGEPRDFFERERKALIDSGFGDIGDFEGQVATPPASVTPGTPKAGPEFKRGIIEGIAEDKPNAPIQQQSALPAPKSPDEPAPDDVIDAYLRAHKGDKAKALQAMQAAGWQQ